MFILQGEKAKREIPRPRELHGKAGIEICVGEIRLGDLGQDGFVCLPLNWKQEK